MRPLLYLALPLAAAPLALAPGAPLACAPAPCARAAFTVLAPARGAFAAACAPPPAAIRVNGVTVALPAAGAPLALPLRAGANVVDVTVAAAAAPALAVAGALAPPARGAALPFFTLEAEDAAFNGSLVGPSYVFTTLAAEASGRRAVALGAAGAAVAFTLPAAANALSVRFSVPDGGADFATPLDVFVDDVFVKRLELTSRYSWYYGAYPFTKNASDGRPHHFFDTVHFMLPARAAAGAVVRLQRPAAAPAAAPADSCAVAAPARADCGWYGINASTCEAQGCCYGGAPRDAGVILCYFPVVPPPPPPTPGNATITIDLVDFSLVDAPAAQPPGSFSVVAAGADPTGVVDATRIFQAALDVPGRVVWVPAGTFLITAHLILNNVTLAGAGAWWSVLSGAGAGLFGRRAADGGSAHVGVHDLAVVGDVRIRDDSSPMSGFGGAFSDSVIANVRILHQKCGMWLDGPFNNLVISSVVISDTTADGINFHEGATNSVVENSFVRNTGDDCLAMWSGGAADVNCTFRGNTLALPVLANAAAIYGGEGNALLGNVVADTLTEGGGLHVGQRFASTPLAGITRVINNTATRAGSDAGDYPSAVGALWFFALDASMRADIVAAGNELVDSPGPAVVFLAANGNALDGVAIDGLTISGAGGPAFDLHAAGSAAVRGAVATGLRGAGVGNCSAAFAFVDGGGNEGWGAQACDPRRAAPPPPALNLTGVVASVWTQPTRLQTATPCDASLNYDLGCNSFWLRDDSWATYLGARATMWPLVRASLGDAAGATVIISFNAFLADSSGGVALARLRAVLADVASARMRALLLIGRPDYFAPGNASDTHDVVHDARARAYLLARVGDVLAAPGVARGLVAASVYWLGAFCEAHGAGFCAPSDIAELTRDLRGVAHAAGVAYVQHLDGTFWDACWPQPCAAWDYGGYSLASLNATADGLLAESWVQGSLVGGVRAVVASGVATAASVLLLDDTPNCDLRGAPPCATGSLAGDAKAWAGMLAETGVRAWGVWDAVDGGVAGANDYGDVTNDGTNLTAKGFLHRARVLAPE